MKRVLACVLMLDLLTGCGSRSRLPYAREMGDTALIRAVGVDVVQEEVELTVSAEERSGEQEGAFVLSARGTSLPAAALAVQSLGDDYVYYGYADQLLFGEEQAMQGVAHVVDHLARESELSLGMQLWVVRGAAAGEAIRAEKGRGIPARLAQLQTDGEVGAASLGCTAARLMSVLAREGSAYLPALILGERYDADGGWGQETSVLPGGYAILRRGKLVCWVNDEPARGLELMEGGAFGHVVDLMLEDGARVSLTLQRARTNCRPVFRNGDLSGLDVNCWLTAQVAQTGRKLTRNDVAWLQDALERRTGEQIVRVVELSQYWDADFMDLERRIQVAQPAKKTQIEKQWDAAFRSLDIRVEVRGTIERALEM